MRIVSIILTLPLMLIPVLQTYATASQDPWVLLQEAFNKPDAVSQPTASVKESDPWVLLRTVFLPFSEDEEKKAVDDPGAGKSLAQKINRRLAPYDPFISRASALFDIPGPVIKSVIMAESGGNPDAKTRLSSAKGLMQTIDTTFAMARKGLAGMGITIKNDPFDPEASVMAGTWYLDRMYKRALADRKMVKPERQDTASWRYPLEYYYAGPAHGVKQKNKILVFSKGTKRVIDKRAYSKKIQTWAEILDRSRDRERS